MSVSISPAATGSMRGPLSVYPQAAQAGSMRIPLNGYSRDLTPLPGRRAAARPACRAAAGSRCAAAASPPTPPSRCALESDRAVAPAGRAPAVHRRRHTHAHARAATAAHDEARGGPRGLTAGRVLAAGWGPLHRGARKRHARGRLLLEQLRPSTPARPSHCIRATPTPRAWHARMREHGSSAPRSTG